MENTKIFVFYPKEGVSNIQKLQMVTQEGKMLRCAQAILMMPKAALRKFFSDRGFAGKLREKNIILSSANSINWEDWCHKL